MKTIKKWTAQELLSKSDPVARLVSLLCLTLDSWTEYFDDPENYEIDINDWYADRE